MAVTLAALALLLAMGQDPLRAAPPVHVDTDMTVGHSTEGVDAAAMQIRLFGASADDWRFLIEGAWGGTATNLQTDAFGAAYPYRGDARLMEAFVEKMFRPAAGLIGVKAGRYRTPFGISSRSDYAYNGFLRAPLIRYGGNFALSNEFLETGADVLVGRPHFNVESSLGTPTDADDVRRRSGLDTVVRAQAYAGSVIVGASLLHTQTNLPDAFATGAMVFRGVDGRWMRGGVMLRGEWIDGRPFDAVSTRGGYVDVSVHRVGMGPVTVVGRAERLDYDAGPFSKFLRRYTAGARVRLTPTFAAVVDVLNQPEGLASSRRVALDAGVTCSLRF
jgi:hypothetical protein